ncbi:hypothetical protein C8Q77DRAFT_1045819 [Trametes polyzona]|nr:hypothetical protein C8Q77DRAFT_1045819 [Trametes polyzona]
MKITHPSGSRLGCAVPLSDPLCAAPAAATSPSPDQCQSHSVRPLASCLAANGVCELREHDALVSAPEQMPQTLLSRTASHQLLHKQPQRAAKSAVVSATPCAHATPEDGCHISSCDAWSLSPPARVLRPLCPSAAAPPMAYNLSSHAGPSTSRSDCSPSSSSTCAFSAPEMSTYESNVLNFLYEGLDQAPYGGSNHRASTCARLTYHLFCRFPEDVYSQFDFPVGGELSELQGCEPDMASPNPQSPILRSMSRSSFGSGSYRDSSSPGDYPTPASGSSVTTPALSEASFGWLPELRRPLFGQADAAFAPEAKTKGGLECSYVHPFPGSAPLSPNAFLTYAFDACQPSDPLALPSTGGSGLAGARRHSEPANVAALQFPLFFQEQLSQISLPAPDAPATRPITDNLASSSPAAGPSSIAPHQTQLPRRLEIMQPKPVRAYKPPILRGDLHYDPKDFVRRQSEPVLPLRELDVLSHWDVTDESPEDDSVMFEGSDEGSYDEDSSDDVSEEMLMDDFAFEGLDEYTFPVNDAHGEPLFNPGWSWPQDATTNPQPFAPVTSQQAWSGADTFAENIDWSAAFAVPPTSGFSSDTRSSGYPHM